jgi:hypothetical protein
MSKLSEAHTKKVVDLEEELNRVRKELIDAAKAKEDALAEAHSHKLSAEFTEQEADVCPCRCRPLSSLIALTPFQIIA